MARSRIKMQRSGIEMGLWTGTYFWVVFAIHVSIAIPENNAKNSAPQSVNYCVTDFRRTPVRLQICSLQFALCSTAFFALFSGLAIVPPANAPSPSAVLPGGWDQTHDWESVVSDTAGRCGWDDRSERWGENECLDGWGMWLEECYGDNRVKVLWRKEWWWYDAG